MRPNLYRFFLIFVITWIFIALPPAQAEETHPNDLREHVEALVNAAPRLAGTQGESLAAEYVKEEFVSYGIVPEVRDFALKNAYVFRGGRLTIIDPVRDNVEFVPLIGSPSTEGAIAGDLVYLENFPDSLDPYSDEVILTERKNFDRVREISPRAIVLYEENKPAWTDVYSPNSLKSTVITISSSAAQRIVELQRNSEVRIRLDLDVRIDDLVANNVVATLPGESDETIIVSAHHDSVLTPGAIDGASGVAVMLEVAKELSDEKLQRTVKFVSFGAEEYDYAGSRHFIENVENDDVLGVLDIGPICSGFQDKLRIGLERNSKEDSTPWLGAYVRKVADNLRLESSYGISEEINYYYSSYLSFVGEGIPATWIYWMSEKDNRLFFPIHTSMDNLRSVDENNLKQTTRLIIHSTRRLTRVNLEEWHWRYSFPERVSFFTVFASIIVVIGIGGIGYLRHSLGKKQKEIVWAIILLLLMGIFILYLFLIWGAVQIF